VTEITQNIALAASRLAEIKMQEEQGRRILRQKLGISDNVVAAAAAHFGTTRELADKIKRDLELQLDITRDCPYCGLPIGDAIHADHIYPVSKGGLSTVENMVLICEQCNLKKGSKTLRQFITANNLDGKRIELVLESLRKHF
jgi:5-methylcytosine-specific restriction endonuclease McrA